jgi:nitroimidazol reductase NimA-like FMN-containing flavoprotein (pyridoxamine 5'-phosphate oxidase superfamily)
MSDSEAVPVSERTRVTRRPHRGHYDRATIDAILDEGFVAHLGLVTDGQPFVIPTVYGRDGDRVLIHGSSGSRMMRTAGGGDVDVCLTVTLVDGVVIARAAFNQSINYRSVVIIGRGEVITDHDQKVEALELLSERLVPGCWESLRKPTRKELAATAIIEVALDEVSAKIREGHAVEDQEDYILPTWSGIVPARLTFGDPIPDPHNLAGLVVPEFIRGYRRAPRTEER